MDYEAADGSSVFCFRWAKDKVEAYGDEEPDSMSDAEIKFSESLVILQHVETGLWITYQALGLIFFSITFKILRISKESDN